jgi:GNAT superfamily N-acetyltransferase
MRFTVEKVTGDASLKQFIDFPHTLYAKDPNYVPELYMSQKALLDRQKHPFFEHAQAEYWLARADNSGDIVGRIAAIKNDYHNEFSGKNDGFWGFFEAVEDYEVARSLLGTAITWLKDQGLSTAIGPVNYSTNESCGLLIDNFSEPPYILTTYNPPYYVDFLERYGFETYTDLLSYQLTTDVFNADTTTTAQKLTARLAERGVTIRTLNMKHYDAEIDRFLKIYNASWHENLGFVPMTDGEVRQMGKDMKMIIDPNLVFFAERNGEVIGAALTVPNVNEVLINIRRGRLFPLGIVKLLWGLKKIKSVRVIALGILPEFRRTGLDICLYVKTYEAALKKGVTMAEASWILADNALMNRALERIGGKVYRSHRLYTKAI